MAEDILPVPGRSLDLTPSLRAGLKAITVLAFLSFFAASFLFCYLAYKLVWHFYIKPATTTISTSSRHRGDDDDDDDDQAKAPQNPTDFALGIEGVFSQTETVPGKDERLQQQRQQERGRRGSTKPDRASTAPLTTTRSGSSVTGAKRRAHRSPPNQFIILLLNLLLADMHQGVAFFLNVEWLRRDQIHVGNATCFTQGLFVSTGDLASSCFITAIAVHAYLSVVKRIRPSGRVIYGTVAVIWLFVYLISTIPIAVTRNGRSVGGFFVRAGSWCWMNDEYSELRLLTHYLFIFIAIAITTTLYTLIFIHLRRRSANPDRVDSEAQAAVRNPAFLIYPVIYVTCTLPLALGRIASMAGADVPLGYMCFAGAMIASNGSFDCLLFGTTRNVLVFASKHDVDRADTGITTFNFNLVHPPSRPRRYGNMVWVQGGDGNGGPSRRGSKAGGEDKLTGGWWSWQRLGGGASDVLSERVLGHKHHHSRSVSQESLRGPGAIQMDTVTSVVVEVDHGRERDPRYPEPTGSTSSSVNSTDKD
jgi:hypothetical protein